MTSRLGDWIQTFTGCQMWPLDPRSNEIHIEDIAHALSNLCRFNGHVRQFYSVAEHSCHVHDNVDRPWQLAGLLHDASEAYLCDMPRPIKRIRGFSDQYIAAEQRLMQAIADRFVFEWPLVAQIHTADNRLLATEAAQLMNPIHPEWKDHAMPIRDLILPCWTPAEAREQFLMRYAMHR